MLKTEMDEETQLEHQTKTNKMRNSSITKKDWIFYTLFLWFGLGSWLNLNGIWIELPLLIPRLPEGWKLSSQLGMASNLANVGPLIIFIIRLSTKKSSSYEVPSVCLIFIVGIVFPIVLSLTWFHQMNIFGQNRSIYLLIFGFFLALVNCTSSVTYLPFVNRFDKKWLNIYFGGESLSSLIPALLGLLQGVGEKPKCVQISPNSTEFQVELSPPRFSVQIYLICLSCLMFISFISFIILWKQQKNKEKDDNLQLNENKENLLTSKENENNCEEKKRPEKKYFNLSTKFYLLLVLWTSILLIGVIPSINSYSLNPYGAETFHYILIITQCCYPLVSLIASLFPNTFTLNNYRILVSTSLGTIAFIYISITAVRSPCSPFVEITIGKYIIGFSWILLYLVFYYGRISLGNYLNEHYDHRGLFWYGLLTQIGAFIGAVIIFLLTSYDCFQERDLCRKYSC